MPQDIAEMLNVKVSRLTDLTPHIRLFELQSVDDSPLPAFKAGAHIDLLLGNGFVRSYSLVNDETDRHRYLIAVKQEAEGEGGSRWIHANVGDGTGLQIYPPKNDFRLSEDADHTILIAGGIGITPLVSMARRLLSLDKSFELHFCAGSADTAPFADRLPKLIGERLRFHFTQGEAAGGRLDLTELLAKVRPNTHIYVCGPKALIEDARSACSHWGSDYFHSELFTTHVHRLEDDRPDLSGAEPFEITLASSGRTMTVASDRTLLETLLANGVKVQAVCKQGWCGTCTTGLLGGQADHRDEYLDPAEQAANDKIQVCVSRAMPGERLILDL